jgi:twitching motility protein PilT
MATLDRFLQLMFEKQGTAVVLESDKQVVLQVGAQRAALTKETVPTPKIIPLLKEIMPEGMRPQLDAGGDGRVAFGYIMGDKRIDAEVDRSGGSIVATLQPAKPRRSTASVAVPAEALLMEKPAPETPVRVSMAHNRPDMEAVHKAEERLQELLRHLVTSGSSDLHLRVELPPCYRIHGELERLEGAAPLTREDIESMILSIMPDRNKTEYAETNDTDYAYEMLGLARFRANAAKDRMGPVAVFRVIPAEIVPVEKLGITPEVQKLCYLTKGLVVVTGPTGSGKSTTLAGMVDLINRTRTDHIITVEDPIEFVHPNKKCVLTQRQVGTHTQSFKRALRAALREDPDIILIGEMRDLETVAIAIETAETGHLVFGTLHTTTATSTVDRIIDQFPSDRQSQIRVMLSESLKGVVAQVLCKKIGGGRVAAREIMLAAGSVSNLIREGKTFQLPSIIQTNKKLGMCLLNDSLIDYVDKKMVEPEEAYMKAVDKAGMEMAFKARNIKLDLKE